MASLPGSEKYREKFADRPQTWFDWLLARAQDEIRIEEILNVYFGYNIPYEARSWKTRCPLAAEHEDGGLDKQFRIYSESNTAYCFESHGRFDLLRLWQMHTHISKKQDAVIDLLEVFEVPYRDVPYQEKFVQIKEKRLNVSVESVVASMNLFLFSLPRYSELQYSPEMLSGMEDFLSQIKDVCEKAKRFEEVNEWFQQQKVRLETLLASL